MYSQKRSIFFSASIVATSLFSAFSAQAEPFIDTSDIFLRSDIQLLADMGHINIPLTTYPLMWKDVAIAINHVDSNGLDERESNAYWHVKQKYKQSLKNRTSIEMHLATDESRFTSFGDKNRGGSFTRFNQTWVGESFFGKFSSAVSEDKRRSHNVQADGSYVGGALGNWVFTFGQQDRWYGPGWDSNLALTNNARPVPALALTRQTSHPFKVPFVDDYTIPWNLTTFMGQLEHDRAVPDALLWGMRINFKPSQNLEIGLTRLAQWSGKDRPSGLSTFWDVFKGEDLCGAPDALNPSCDGDSEPGNQLAGYDFKYHFNLYNVPFSAYMQMIAEDGDSKGGLSLFGEERYMAGIDSRFSLFGNHWLGYVEVADTLADCTDGSDPNNGVVGEGNCYYEHHIYESGMRYEGRVLGNIYENDAKTVVFGMVSQLNELESWEFKARYLDLNYDNTDRYPNNDELGNTVTQIAEEMLMFSAKYQRYLGRFKYTIGGNIAYSTFENDDKDSETEPNVFFNVEYNL